ncbi:nitroreductase [Anaerocolumna cellulosilytica]|uniref:Nitroreductase n=1 Tax=Anaerocolumna cellulosilytica TaxID=433286 RepID=A0A6S6QRP6_9FIRM|nr:nitroreductase family protein [Anaerocolumna cellulosilytica]MBB5194331.1 nitroreductase/NAD-dependent dihydropyrimidine dehydrogenase PreA subunit [Anaerocolumna cellulosilytica]BCJ93274.1 nitroreductase [Anaerocolumna cellulosilytica]
MIYVDKEKCIGCGSCVKDCFPGNVEIVDKKAVVHNEACMLCGHCIAVCPSGAISTDEYDMEEVSEYKKETHTLEADNLLNFIKFRRTVRQFQKKEVSKELLLRIIEAGRFTQTGGNAQDITYTVITNQLTELKAMTYETLKKLGKEIIEAEEGQESVLSRYANMWIDMAEEYEKGEKDRLFFHAPVVLVVSAKSVVNGTLVSSNMELMTNALGLGTFFSGFFVRAAQANPDIIKLLDIPDEKQIATCMVIGYPAVKYHRTVPRREAFIYWK